MVRRMRSASPFASMPDNSASRVAASIPQATASPCSNRDYSVSASIAWPTVWPKFRMRRRSPSRSSAETTSALILTAAAISSSTTAGSIASTLPGSRSSRSNSCAIADDAAFHHFEQSRAIFARRKRRQHLGIDQHRQRLMKTPDQILAASQIDARLAADRRIHLREQVVGICSTGTPRMKIAARNPLTSVTMPPPNAITMLVRSAPRSTIWSASVSTCAKSLVRFAAGKKQDVEPVGETAPGASLRAAAKHPRWLRQNLAVALSNELSRAMNDAPLHHVLVHALRGLDGKAWHVIPLYHLHCPAFTVLDGALAITLCIDASSPHIHTDFIVVGAGVAGLRAAIELASAGRCCHRQRQLARILVRVRARRHRRRAQR